MANEDHRPDSEAAVVFADICESSRLYTERGDRVAFEIASQCLDVLSEATRAAGGRPVKRLGDGLLSTFDSPRAAVEAAVAMLVAVEGAPWAADPRVRVHIGIGHGGVVFDGGDVHGDVVNVAARLASLAKADEILLSGHAYERLPAELREAARRIDEIRLRSRPGAVAVYQYLPAGGEADETIRSPTPWQPTEIRLELAYGAETLVMGADRSRLCLGRDPDNDLTIAGSLVSRHHAEIVCQHEGFVLRDMSTNGSYVVADDGQSAVRVVRGERALGATGIIALGAADGPAVRFRRVD